MTMTHDEFVTAAMNTEVLPPEFSEDGLIKLLVQSSGTEATTIRLKWQETGEERVFIFRHSDHSKEVCHKRVMKWIRDCKAGKPT